jgi:hypothetical protein
MSTYILAAFWINVGGLAINMLELMLRDHWPHETKTTIGMQCAKVMGGAAFAVWGGFLLWGPR